MNLAGLAWSSEWPLPPRGVVLAGDAPVKKMEGGRLRVGCFRDSNGKRSCSKLLLNRGASRKQIPISDRERRGEIRGEQKRSQPAAAVGRGHHAVSLNGAGQIPGARSARGVSGFR